MGEMGLIFDLAVTALVAGLAGLACRRVGLSVVVGYLAAGIVIGPYTPPFQLVQDADRVRMLADLGLLFMVFGIGLGFSIQRARRLGAPLLVAAGLGALLVLLGCRAAASAVGLTGQQGLFVAGVLMVSSSAIISKVLEEVGSYHTRAGQLALGVTLLEDIVAVVMLTLLSSIATIGGAAGGASLWQTVTSFTSFVALFSVVVLLLLPRLLRRLVPKVPIELVMLCVTGLLLSLGWIAARLGYSMALTAFILGAVIGSTPHRADIDRLFEGMRHLFGAVFFVAMGMMFDVRMLPQFWPGLLALAVAAFALRVPATAAALAIAGNGPRDSLRAALSLTPLGEFSFVIAYLGVQTGLMPAEFYPAAVGASLLTCAVSPVLIRRAEPLSESIERLLPAPMLRTLEAYHSWLEGLQSARERSIAWKLMAPRVVQTAMQLLAAGGLIALAMPAYRVLVARTGPDLLFAHGTPVIFLMALGLLLLPGLVAVYRNISALAMIAAEATGGGRSAAARRLVERAFASAALAFAALWLAVLVPDDVLPPSILAAIVAVLLLATVLLWRNLVRWHSQIESRLQDELAAAHREGEGGARQWSLPALERGAEQSLRLREVHLPTNAEHAGRSIMDLRLRSDWGCSVVGIDRQGFAINNPSARDRLYPGDRLLLLGTREALDRTAAFLAGAAERPAWMQHFDELASEHIAVPPRSACAGRTLAELDLFNRHGVQIGAIRRAGREIVAPDGRETIAEGDRLLVLGAHRTIRAFAELLRTDAAPR